MIQPVPRALILGCLFSGCLMLLDLLTPEDLRVSLLYPLPVLYTAWHALRWQAWMQAVSLPVIYMLVRILAGRPWWPLLQWTNWVIFLAVLVVQIELVWRGRHCLLRLSEALLQERQSRTEM
jgi:hypothetical protein